MLSILAGEVPANVAVERAVERLNRPPEDAGVAVSEGIRTLIGQLDEP